MLNNSWTEKILKDGDKVHFQWMTPKYGRAEFEICTKYFRGKLKTVYIYPQQQEGVKEYYRVDITYSDSLSVNSWVRLEDPKIWYHFWCKEHKCPSMRVYVPRESNHFTISVLTNFSISFGKD